MTHEEHDIAARKQDHLNIVANEDISHRQPAGWEDVQLVHRATPEVDLDQVELTTTFLGHVCSAPLLIAGMTGGHPQAHEINGQLAQAAEAHGLPMGVGSQRAALAAPNLARTYAVVRERAPSAFLIANIGAAQLIRQGDRGPAKLKHVERAVKMIRADALAVHLNFLEELVQPEGDRRARGCLAAIRELASGISVPLIAKETGAGLSRPVAEALKDAGVSALDVGGVGGTSFAAVESLRAARRGDVRGQRLGELFRDWGLPTAVSLVETRTVGLPLIATGGVRSGLDAAKALALGATLAGVGRPMLQAALVSADELERWIGQFLLELRAALYLTGCTEPKQLASTPALVLGRTREWLTALGDPL